jgi:hypothetical protein
VVKLEAQEEMQHQMAAQMVAQSTSELVARLMADHHKDDIRMVELASIAATTARSRGASTNP